MTLSRALQLKTASAIWQRAVKSPKRLAGLLVKATPLIVGVQSRSWVKAAFVFARLVNRVHLRQGSRGLALFLKANTLILMRVLAGKKLVHTREAGVAVSVTRRGIPRWIPVAHRKRLLGGEQAIASFYLGILTLYRVLDFKGKLSLSTVLEQGKSLDTGLVTAFSAFAQGAFLDWLSPFKVKPLKPVYDRDDPADWNLPEGHPAYLRGQRLYTQLAPKFKWIFTSGPNSKFTKSVSLGSAWIDFLAIISRPKVLETFNLMRNLTGDLPLSSYPFWDSAVWALQDWVINCISYGFSQGGLDKNPKGIMAAVGPQFDLGALAVVEEPGKKRIVAMVDIWTQWMLYPLHLFVFNRILKRIPQDGTFNQTLPVEGLLARAKEAGRKHLWSYDLSAATDRLPLVLQVAVLTGFVSMAYANLWASLLVERDYRVPKEYYTTYGKQTHVRYAVGQPMGAYSSWAMLALCHHAIVQFAAYRAGHRAWFTWYAVVGDDIVIADQDVASHYVQLMTEFGVKIGFHKSIISDNLSCEFAKRFYLKGVEVTPLSLQGIAVGWLGPGFVPEVLAACESRMRGVVTSYQLGKFLGVGYRASSASAARQLRKLPRILRSAFLLLLRPGAPRGLKNLVQWYSARTLCGEVTNKIKDSEGLFTSIWSQIVDGQVEPTIKRVHKVADKLLLKEQLLGEGFTGPFRDWFKSVVVRRLKSSALRTIDQAGEMLRGAKFIWDREAAFAKALRALNKAEAELQLVPEEFLVTKREVEEKSKTIREVLMNKSVKRWTRTRSYVRERGNSRHSVRTEFSPRADLEKRRALG